VIYGYYVVLFNIILKQVYPVNTNLNFFIDGDEDGSKVGNLLGS